VTDPSSYLSGGSGAHRVNGDVYPDTYGVVEQPPAPPAPPASVEVELPDLDAEKIAVTIMGELAEGWKRLRQEYQDAAGHDLSAVHHKVLRFRNETLAGLMAGPHLPLAEEHLAESVRESAADVLRQVDALLSSHG
jgi:hypothetical protein